MTTVKKRLVVACDGTWLNVDSDWQGASWLSNKKTAARRDPSNVTRMCRALLTESEDGIPQICYYQAGVGTEGSLWMHLIGGLTGEGIEENIREAYAFIANNWNEGDEIVILGFSRGAFTARSISGLIEAIGVLTPVGMVDFLPIFKDWENQLDPDYTYQWPPDAPKGKARPTLKDDSYAQELKKRDLTRLDVPIKAVGVWDTVGALGIPDIGIFRLRSNWREFNFASTEVPSNVEHAFQALALDEHRKPYSPTIWESPTGPNILKQLKQCWFPGAHSNVGGSYPDTGIADLTLTWLVAHLRAHRILAFDPAYCAQQRRLNERFYALLAPSKPPRPWGLGRIYNSMTPAFWLTRSLTRTPGRYTRTDPRTNAPTDVRLVRTQEVVHPSVRLRVEMLGSGPEDRGTYTPRALRGWKVLRPGEPAPKGLQESEGELRGHRWVLERDGDAVVLPEDDLEEAEVELLKMSPEVYALYEVD